MRRCNGCLHRCPVRDDRPPRTLEQQARIDAALPDLRRASTMLGESAQKQHERRVLELFRKEASDDRP